MSHVRDELAVHDFDDPDPGDEKMPFRIAAPTPFVGVPVMGADHRQRIPHGWHMTDDEVVVNDPVVPKWKTKDYDSCLLFFFLFCFTLFMVGVKVCVSVAATWVLIVGGMLMGAFVCICCRPSRFWLLVVYVCACLSFSVIFAAVGCAVQPSVTEIVNNYYNVTSVSVAPTSAPVFRTPTTSSETPTTATPSSQTPTSFAPTTTTPSSQTPTTATPSSQTPTTTTPSSQTPTTTTPTTEAPTTQTPTTTAPTTQTPTTTAPTTQTPTTTAPTTTSPTTSSPTTHSPTPAPTPIL